MNAGNAVMLGIIQGLTEFLPVSSSAHLVIIQSFLKGFRQPGILFDIVLHMGTLVAVIFFLRKEIYALLKALLPSSLYPAASSYAHPSAAPTGRKTILCILVATLFTGIIGLAFKEEAEKLFASPAVAAFMLVITGTLLFLADRIKIVPRSEKGITVTDSIIIGIAQGVAIIPGISRSGATIATGIFRGLAHETAAKFSFMLSIPAVIGAAVLEARHVSLIPSSDITGYAAGFLAAAVTGFLSLKLLFLMLKNRRLGIFAYYCWALGFSVLFFHALYR